MQLISSSKRTIVLIVCGAILGFITLQWLSETTQPKPPVSEDENIHAPDYFMSNFTVITTNENGDIEQSLKGEELTYFKSGLTKIIKPELQLSTEKEITWQANANHGNVSHENQLILDGNVSIKQTNTKFNQIDIQTEQLILNLNTNTAESQTPVTVKSNNGTIEANRMFADLDRHHVQLHSGVKAEYVSP